MSAPVIREGKGIWCIWNKRGRPPRVFHRTREEAEAEAQRLARKRPGHKFIVIQMETKWHVPAGTSPVEEATEKVMSSLKALFNEAGASADEHAQLDAAFAQDKDSGK